MQITTRRAWLLTVPLLLLLMLLLLRVAWGTHMHPDETLVYHFTRFDIPYTVNYLATQDVHPPLWFSFFWVWRHLVGDGEFAGRMQALLFSLLTLAMTYRIGRDWFGKARFGLFSLAILGVSAYFLDYALEIRPYALVMLLAAISMWLFARWLRRRTWRLAIAYAVVTTVMFYVHYFTAFLVIAQVLYFFLRRPSRHLLLQGGGAAALAFALWLPWLPAVLNQVRLLRELAQQAGNAYGLGVGTPATTQPTNVDTILKLMQVATNGQPVLYGVVLALGIALLWRKTHYRLALLWALGVPAVALALNFVAAVYTQRYVAYLAIGLALALGAALAALRRVPLRGVVWAGFVTINLWAMTAWLPLRIPYRDIFRAMAAQPGDVVYFTDDTDQFIQWQIEAYLPPLFTTIEDHDLQSAAEARRVWFMTGDWFSEGVRTQFDALEPTHPVQQVIGQCDRAWCYLAQLMEAPPLSSALRFGANMDFRGIDVDSVTRQTITTRLWWRVEQAPDVDYSISLRLVDGSGSLVAQNDGPINHYGSQIVQTSQFEPGKIYIDWRAIDLPSDLPSGTYTLKLVVYQSWDNLRLLTNGSDSLTLYTFSLD